MKIRLLILTLLILSCGAKKKASQVTKERSKTELSIKEKEVVKNDISTDSVAAFISSRESTKEADTYQETETIIKTEIDSTGKTTITERTNTKRWTKEKAIVKEKDSSNVEVNKADKSERETSTETDSIATVENKYKGSNKQKPASYGWLTWLLIIAGVLFGLYKLRNKLRIL